MIYSSAVYAPTTVVDVVDEALARRALSPTSCRLRPSLRPPYAAKHLMAEKQCVGNLERPGQEVVDLVGPLACKEPAPAGRRASVRDRVRECAASHAMFKGM